MLASTYPGHSPHYNTIVKWYGRFKENNYCLEDEDRSGRPIELDLNLLKTLVESDPFQSTRTMANILGVSHKTIANGLRKIDKVKKLGRFVPHHLAQFDLDRRIECCTYLLSLYL